MTHTLLTQQIKKQKMNSLKNMPADARLWVFQSNRKLSDAEVNTIEKLAAQFITRWTSHGAKIAASFNVFYDRFIVFAIDEQQAQAGGCSIDSLNGFMKELGQSLNINFFDRLQVAYRKENEILTCALSEFEKLAKQKMVDESTIVFNNMVISKSSFEKEWEVPVKQSWHKRVLVSES